MSSTDAAAGAWRKAARGERGVALISALSALLLLTPLTLALLSMSTFELLISRNLVNTTQALYNAEAGIEWAFNLLVNTPDWDVLVAGPDDIASPVGGPPAADEPALTTSTLVAPTGVLPVGTAVTVRKDAAASALAVTATGTVLGAQRTIEAVIKREPTVSAGGPDGPSPSHGIFAGHAVVSWRERH
jgi:Tfp pilus assembly protein PilX